MNSDIQKAIAIIDQRISNLMDIRNKLTDEFGGVPAPIRSAIVHPITSSGDGSGNGNGNQSRKEQLAKFLIENGPSKRGTINEKSGIPKGTIANLLNKDGFVRRHGKWTVAETSSSATQETTH
jgi:hypothetical protein